MSSSPDRHRDAPKLGAIGAIAASRFDLEPLPSETAPPHRARQDITQIREITSQQMLIADDLARLIETANAPIFGVDLNGQVTEWNRKAADMLGYSMEELRESWNLLVARD